MDAIKWFADLGRTDTAVAGGKGANLGELTRGGFPVPPGFVVTAPAYLDAMEQGGVRVKLAELASSSDADDPAATADLAGRMRDLVAEAGMPDRLRAAIADAYRTLGEGAQSPCVRVAVRSSATAEDTASSSFAGMNRTFTNVSGEDAVVARVVDCWASLFGERVLAYRSVQGVVDEPAIAVVVQQMVDSDRSGVVFSADPATGDRSLVVIEAAWGLGEIVVSGAVEPDTYVVAKDGPRLVSARVGNKTAAIDRDADGQERRRELEPAEALRRVLSDEEVLEVAGLGLRVEAHYGEPQDMEWAYAGGVLYLVQSRPITTLLSDARSATGDVPATAEEAGFAGRGPGEPLVKGLGAAPGVVAGRVRVLRSVADGRRLERGEVLVAPMTTPDWVPTMRRAAALVTDGGGVTCHAAIASRELRVPCVVGTRRATELLRDGELVTVDGASGAVYEGDVERVARRPAADRRGRGAGGRGVAGRRGATRHAPLRQPRDRRARGGGRGAPRRRRRAFSGPSS